MSLRDRILPLADKLRSLPGETTLAGNAGLDVRPNSLTVRTRTWASGRPGDGSYADVDLELVPRPRMREVTSREVAASGGRYADSDLRVGPITPQYTDASGTHGYTPAQLAPNAPAAGVEILYVVAGSLAGEYALVDTDFSAATRYFLTLRLRRRTP